MSTPRPADGDRPDPVKRQVLERLLERHRLTRHRHLDHLLTTRSSRKDLVVPQGALRRGDEDLVAARGRRVRTKPRPTTAERSALTQ